MRITFSSSDISHVHNFSLTTSYEHIFPPTTSYVDNFFPLTTSYAHNFFPNGELCA
jgi:hypothetical protein